MRFLVDASAFYPLAFIEGGEYVLVDSYIMDLTVYEIGNIIWKRTRRGLVDFSEVIASMEDLFGLVEILRIDHLDLREIETMAVKQGLTFYDSAYLYYSERKDLILVTEDQELAEKAGSRAMGVEEALEDALKS
ncbi:MAG: type II toxin-antitoxin system VapC family toxin, partial [Candidatus Korarchaeota archaeon]|nr:type II toxin-antitoxin system VapC family toxin [Candidatus Korarchaeota archaeon]